MAGHYAQPLQFRHMLGIWHVVVVSLAEPQRIGMRRRRYCAPCGGFGVRFLFLFLFLFVIGVIIIVVGCLAGINC